MEINELWTFTVIRAQGLSFLRPEKSWRPIVTVSVDQNHHELLLGADGQNVNLKAPCLLQSVDSNSRIDLQVWHKSQSKRKGKRRNLVASACHSLGDLLKRHELDSKIEVRLNCPTTTKRGCASKGKPQNGAYLIVRLVPPPGLHSSRPLDIWDAASEVSSTLHEPHSTMSECSDEPDPIEEPPQKLRRRRVKGYCVDSDDPNDSTDCELSSDEEKPLLHHHHSDDDYDDKIKDPHGWEEEGENIVVQITPGAFGWILNSILPTCTEAVQVPTSTSPIERFLSLFTMYGELKNATHDSHFDAVFTRLQSEWTYIGGFLVALAAVDTAVFSMSSSPGSLFTVDNYAQNCIAASSIATGLGISCDAWFLLRYNWADLHTFRTRALDLYSTYFFFSLSARLPALSLLISSLSILGFLGRVAYITWPEAVMVISFVFGVLMGLQFLVFGVHWVFRGVVGGVRGVGRGVGRVLQLGRGRGGGGEGPPAYEVYG